MKKLLLASRRFPRLRLAMISLALVISTVLIERSLPLSGESKAVVSTTLANVATIVGDRRVLGLRLTSYIGHRSCQTSSSDDLYCADQSLPSAADLGTWRQLSRSLQNRLDTRETAEDWHATGLLYLSWPKLTGAQDKAILALQRAQELAGGADAAILSDLGCAYLLKAQNGPASLRVRSLEAVEQAYYADPKRPETLHNRALILEDLSLTEAASRSWSELLELETDAAWLAEALGHLNRLEKKMADDRYDVKSAARRALAAKDSGTLSEIARTYPRRLRLFVEEDLLPLWARAVEGKETPASELLHDIRLTAAALAAATGDRLLALSAKVLVDACEHWPRAYRELAEAHLLYFEGRDWYDGRRDYVQARVLFERAARLMERWDSPFSLWPRFYTALCLYRTSKPRGLENFLRLSEETAGRPFPVLRGHVSWMLGLAYYHQARLTESTSVYLAALEDFRAASDFEGEAAMLSQLSLNALRANDREKGWSYRLAALDLVPRLTSPRRLGNLFEMLVLGATAEGLYAAGMRFQERLDETALNSPQPILSANAWRRRARMAAQAGLPEEALRSLEEAKLAALRIPLPETREIVEGQILLAEAEVQRPNDPAAALRSLDRAIELLERHDQQLEVMAAHRLRGLALHQSGDSAGAARRLEQALTIGLRARFEGDHRKAFFQHAQAILGDLVYLAADQGQDAVAFRYNEHSRLLALQSAFGIEDAEMSTVEPSNPASIARRIPADTVLLSFRFSHDELLVWTLRETVALDRLKVDDSTLEPLVTRLLNGLHAGRDRAALASDLSRLYRELIEPLEPRLGGVATVLVQPDQLLYRLPFAALVDGHGRYLIERFAIGVVPSASLWSARSEGAFPRRYQRLAAVGDPAFSAALYPGLEPLPNALKEAVEVAALYPDPVVLTEGDATRAHLLEALAEADLFHFAGHAVHRPEEPGASALVTAVDAGTDDGAAALTAADIRRLRLDHIALVVLSACDTGAASTLEREGNHNLASAFYLAGVPSVLSSLWHLNDRQAIDFALELHRQMRSSAGPLKALAQTQRAALRGDLAALSAPSHWAAFQLFGGDGEPFPPH